VNPLAIINLEGVMVDGVDLKASPPTKNGRMLYDALKGQYQMVVLSTCPSYELARAWLKREYITGFGSVFCRPDNTILSPVEWKMTQIREMQSEGWPVMLYVDADPTAIRAAILEGVSTALVTTPRFARPEWRPDADHSFRSWESLVDTIESEHLLKAPEG
jgi:hypothetical protein